MRKPASFYLGLLLSLAVPAAGQQPADTAPVASPSQPPPAPLQTSRATSASRGKKKPLPIYLITGTVFNEKALSFPDVKVRIRQTNDKRFRWETYTNSRGEFAERVPEGNEYEVQVQVKNFKGQSQTVKADAGSVQQRLSFRLEPLTPGKSGDKK